MSASTTSTRFIAPYVASMDASGAADYEYIQQETVSISGIDYEFDVTLDASGAAKLLNAFTVSGKGTDSNFNVVLSNSADFQAVLASVINGADEASNATTSKTATTQLEADLEAGLLAAINVDDLINTVQDVGFTNVDVTIASAAGAADMASNLTNERCRLIYTQIPWGSRNNKYMDADENQTTSALPLLAGDVLTFVFDVDLSDVEPAKSQDDVNTSADPAGVTSGTSAGNYTSGLHYNLASKRIAFNIAMPGASGEELAGLTPA
jgi:hypothetical protein